MPVRHRVTDHIGQRYSKLIWAVRRGYDNRPDGVNTRIKGLVVHTTNGRIGSSFSGEAKFLRDSPDVSAHFLVGKQGQIELIVPTQLRAWHAGNVVSSRWSNDYTIGIECHYTPGENWTTAMKDALQMLCGYLLYVHGLKAADIETHRFVAFPPKRKVDPSGWTDDSFYAWRSQLASPHYEVVVQRANIRYQPTTESNIIDQVDGGDLVQVITPVRGQSVDGISDWVQLIGGGYIHRPLISRGPVK